ILVVLSSSATDGIPMLSTVTFPPRRSFILMPSSTAYMSYGFMIASTPSRMMVLVSLFIFTSVVAGTCFTHTTMFIQQSTPDARFGSLAPNRLFFRQFLDQLQSNNISLDLVRSLVYLGDLSITHPLLNRIFLHITVSAEDLHGICRHLHCCI